MGFWSSLLPGSVGVKEISPTDQKHPPHPTQNPAGASHFPPSSRPATSAGPTSQPAAYSSIKLARQFPAEPDLLPEIVLPGGPADEKKMPAKRARGFSLGRRKNKDKEDKVSAKDEDARRTKKDEELRKVLASEEEMRRKEEAEWERSKEAERARLRAVHEEYRVQEVQRLQAQEDAKLGKVDSKQAEEQRRLKVAQDEQKARDEAKRAEVARKIQAIEDEKSDKEKLRIAKEDEKRAAEARKQKAIEEEKKAKEDERRAKEEEKRLAEEAKIRAKEEERRAKEEEKRAKEEEKAREKEEKLEAKLAKIEARKSMDDTRSIVSVSTLDGRRRLTKRRPSTSMGSRPSSRASRMSMDRPRTANRENEPPVPRLSISSPYPPVLPPIAPMLPLLEHETESVSWSEGIVPGMAVTTDKPVKSEPVVKPERADTIHRHHYRDSDLFTFNRKRSQSAVHATTHDRQTSWLPPSLEAPNRAPPPVPPPSTRTEPPRPKTSGGAEARRSSHFATLSLTAFGPSGGQSQPSTTNNNLRGRRTLLDMDAGLPMLFPMPPTPGLIYDGETTPTSSSANTHSRSGSQEHYRLHGSESPSLRRDVLSKPRAAAQKSPPLASSGFHTDSAIKKIWSEPPSTTYSSGTRGEGEDGTNSFDLLREEQEKEWGKLKQLMEGANNKEKERSNPYDARIRRSDEEDERLRQFDFANAQALAAFDFNVDDK